MVVGIVVVAGGWVPFFAYLGVPAAIVGFALGIAGRRRAGATGSGGGMATAGLILAPLGLALSIGGVWMTNWLVDAVERYEHPARHDVAVLDCALTEGMIQIGGTLANTSPRTASYTLRLEIRWDGGSRRRLVEVDDVAAGAIVDWSDQLAARTDAATAARCNLVEVHGPLPLGFDPG